ncbi:HAD family hydrolase [Streptococcus vestibularis]|uniref:HAD family hydrolase n=1 Tax=Streptococcus vestibularis TaxID=1343 RepID=UPI000E44CB44|nr:HAD family hydrolase [Streptococcus vestibularis]RGM55164.1 HAD family hydrolase [Streptococcus vestibularis]
MMNKVYKNYIFDFYGTLVDILTDEKDPALWDKLAQLYQAYGADYKGEGLRKSYAKRVALARKELIELKGVAYPEVDLVHIFNQLYVDARPQSSNSNQLDDWGNLIAMVFRVLSRKHLTAYPHTKEVLAFLKEQGCRLYLLSNAQVAFTNAEIDLMALRPYFDAIYLSSDAGICKPQPEFLKQVLDDHGLKPSETVMVGNDLTTDIAVAEAVGIDGILLNTFPYSRQELEKSPLKPDRVITDIEALKPEFT